MSRRSVPSRTAAERISLAVQYHRRAESASHQMALWAALCGLELRALKREIAHGDWTNFYAANLADRLPIRTAQNYMRVAEGVKVKNENAFVFGLLEVAPSTLDDTQRAELAAAVESIADGETMASLIEAYRLTKKPAGSASTGGYRPDPAKLAEFLGAYHPALAGTGYEHLPADVQAHYRQWVAKREADPSQLAFDFCRPVFDTFEHPDFQSQVDRIPEAEAARLLDHVEALARHLKERLRGTALKAA